MNEEFPCAVPEIPVTNLARAAVYYERCLGFHWDWGAKEIGQVSKGNCRIFLTDDSFRGGRVKGTPVVIWLNLNSKTEVDDLHEKWSGSGAQIVAKPDKALNLYEFTAADPDGNLFRAF
jgi:predicted lactoylglutathione lyase